MNELFPLFQIAIIFQAVLCQNYMTFIIYRKRMVECPHTEAVTENTGMWPLSLKTNKQKAPSAVFCAFGNSQCIQSAVETPAKRLEVDLK